jgi:hypothetical protein
MLYAQLDSNNVVVAVSTLSAEVVSPNLVPVSNADNLLGKRHVDGVFVEVITSVEPLPEYRRITKLALAVRLGVTVEVALETAATTDPVVRVLLGRVSKASFVDLDDPMLEYGLRTFVDMGHMTSEQVTEVLGAAVLESERPT